MAEIKSALEIAMERAAALGEDQGQEARRQGRAQGKALARRYLEADLDRQGLAEALAAVESGQEEHARQGLCRVLLGALEEGRPRALAGLQLLAAEGEAAGAWQKLAQAEEDRLQSLAGAEAELAAEMSGDLAQAGIAGSAVRPNPKAHPEYAPRVQGALAEAEEQVALAAAALQAALGLESGD